MFFLINLHIIPHNDITIPHNDITIPHHDITIPHHDITIPHHDITIPHHDKAQVGLDIFANVLQIKTELPYLHKYSDSLL